MNSHWGSGFSRLAPAFLIAATLQPAMTAAGVGGEYRADTPFPEFVPMWREGWSWEDGNGQKVRYAHEDMPLGGYLFASFTNTSLAPLSVPDVLLEGISLTEAVAPEHVPNDSPDDRYPSNLAFSKLPAGQVKTLTAAGEPVWWKVEPQVISPGQYGQVTIRLRRDPEIQRLTLTLPTLPEADRRIEIAIDRRQPWFFSINFSPGFDVVYAYLRHPGGKGIAPQRILLDGSDMTPRCTIVADERVDTVPVVIRLGAALRQGTWHHFEASYADGSVARVGIRAWQPGMVYGMWGYSRVGRNEEDNRNFFLEDMRIHNINTLMYSIPNEVRTFLRSPEGQAYSKRTGIRIMAHGRDDAVNPPFFFLTDEPDAADFMVRKLDPFKRIGSLGQWLVRRSEMFRRENPSTPVLLNVDNTYKPENWYTYAQLADLPCADPYYLEGMHSVLKYDPVNLASYLKPTYVYGVGTIYQSAGAPKPMHLILHSCRFDMADFPLRGPTPVEKRIEVYYALAAGAKALSYWWYTPFGEYYGCGGSDPSMRALWKEIGLLGAEILSAEPLLIRSSPAQVDLQGTGMLWMRALLAGDDAMALIVANDNFASDRLGTAIRPLRSARVRVQVPRWLKPGDVFEVTSGGTRDVAWEMDSAQLTLELGEVDVTRFVIASTDALLRRQVQTLYEERYRANVRALMTRPGNS